MVAQVTWRNRMNSRKLLNILVLVTMLASVLLVSGASPARAESRQSPQAASSGSAKAMPAGPTDESKVPHYFGPFPNWALSPVTTAAATVTITDPGGLGAGAAASATVAGDGIITGLTITSPGSGYTAADVTITGAGTGASATATVSA